jgi:hypothetical protein
MPKLLDVRVVVYQAVSEYGFLKREHEPAVSLSQDPLAVHTLVNRCFNVIYLHTVSKSDLLQPGGREAFGLE